MSVNMGQIFIKVSGEGHEVHEGQKVFLKTLQILQENTCVGVSLIKLQASMFLLIPQKTSENLWFPGESKWKIETYNFIIKRLQHRCFLVSFSKFLRTPFLNMQTTTFESIKPSIHNVSK